MLQWKGEQQEGRVGKPLDPFEVKFLDEEGLPCQLVPVEFKIIQGEGEFTFKDETTDLGGNAIAEFVPSTDGWYRIECLLGEGDDRKVVPFKGSIKPDRRKRSGTTNGVGDNWQEPAPPAVQHTVTVIPAAAVPPPMPPVEQAPQPVQPVVQVTVSMSAQAAPAPRPEIAKATPPPPPVPQRAAKPAAAQPAPKPAPKPVQAPAPRRPQPQPAVRTATAVLPRAMPRPAPLPAKPRPAAPQRRAPRSKPLATGLVIALIVLYALLTVFVGILVGQSSSRTSPSTAVIECSSNAWVLTGNTVTYRNCTTALR
jgi:hypothetical protein